MQRKNKLAVLAIGALGAVAAIISSQSSAAPGRDELVPGADLPDTVVRALSQWFPLDFLQKIDLQVAVPSRRAVVACPSLERSMASVSPAALVRIGANPAPWQVVIHPEYYGETTASQIALIAHEATHVMQREADPKFAEKFTRAALATHAAGLAPWENPYEAEAYAAETRIRQALVAQGYAAGALA